MKKPIVQTTTLLSAAYSNPAIDLHRIRSIRGFCRFYVDTRRKLFRPFSLMPGGQRNATLAFRGTDRNVRSVEIGVQHFYAGYDMLVLIRRTAAKCSLATISHACIRAIAPTIIIIRSRSVSNIRLTGCTVVSSGAVTADFPEQAASKAVKQVKESFFSCY